MQAQSTILQVKNLKKYFPTAGGLLYAVDNVSLSIRKGETLGIVGESGCGKSKLGRTFATCPARKYSLRQPSITRKKCCFR